MGIVIILYGIALILMSVIMIIKPDIGEKFLQSFASSARAHYFEQLIRMVFGVALVLHPSYDRFGEYMIPFGWVIIVTTVGLLFIPWRWHQKFAMRVVPPAIQFMKVYALLMFILGILLVWVV